MYSQLMKTFRTFKLYPFSNNQFYLIPALFVINFNNFLRKIEKTTKIKTIQLIVYTIKKFIILMHFMKIINKYQQ